MLEKDERKLVSLRSARFKPVNALKLPKSSSHLSVSSYIFGQNAGTEMIYYNISSLAWSTCNTPLLIFVFSRVYSL